MRELEAFVRFGAGGECNGGTWYETSLEVQAVQAREYEDKLARRAGAAGMRYLPPE